VIRNNASYILRIKRILNNIKTIKMQFSEFQQEAKNIIPSWVVTLNLLQGGLPTFYLERAFQGWNKEPAQSVWYRVIYSLLFF